MKNYQSPKTQTIGCKPYIMQTTSPCREILINHTPGGGPGDAPRRSYKPGI